VVVDAVSSLKTLATPWYSDQILPFDITLAGTNEMGAATTMRIYGVEILNEGSGVSIDDAVTEMQATFVARTIGPWQAVASKFQPVLYLRADQGSRFPRPVFSSRARLSFSRPGGRSCRVAVMLTVLEVFVLEACRLGVNTAYALKAKAGLSVGAVIPVLKRLYKGKLLTSKVSGPRVREEFRLTALGQRELAGALSRFARLNKEDVPRDMESVLRIAVLLWARGRKKAAVSVLHLFLEGLERRGEESIEIDRSSIFALHHSALAARDSLRVGADAKAIKNVLSAMR